MCIKYELKSGACLIYFLIVYIIPIRDTTRDTHERGDISIMDQIGERVSALHSSYSGLHSGVLALDFTLLRRNFQRRGILQWYWPHGKARSRPFTTEGGPYNFFQSYCEIFLKFDSLIFYFLWIFIVGYVGKLKVICTHQGIFLLLYEGPDHRIDHSLQVPIQPKHGAFVYLVAPIPPCLETPRHSETKVWRRIFEYGKTTLSKIKRPSKNLFVAALGLTRRWSMEATQVCSIPSKPAFVVTGLDPAIVCFVCLLATFFHLLSWIE